MGIGCCNSPPQSPPGAIKGLQACRQETAPRSAVAAWRNQCDQAQFGSCTSTTTGLTPMRIFPWELLATESSMFLEVRRFGAGLLTNNAPYGVLKRVFGY